MSLKAWVAYHRQHLITLFLVFSREHLFFFF